MDTNQTKWTMAPYMLEVSHSYCRSAKTIWDRDFSVAIVMAALSIEITLKSFNSEVAANEGELNEKYRFRSKCLNKGENKHDLVCLYRALPQDVKIQLGDSFVEDMLEKYRSTFISERYIYEPSARQGGTDTLLYIAEKLIQKSVQIYKNRGCEDPWIVQYPNV